MAVSLGFDSPRLHYHQKLVIAAKARDYGLFSFFEMRLNLQICSRTCDYYGQNHTKITQHHTSSGMVKWTFFIGCKALDRR